MASWCPAAAIVAMILLVVDIMYTQTVIRLRVQLGLTVFCLTH